MYVIAYNERLETPDGSLHSAWSLLKLLEALPGGLICRSSCHTDVAQCQILTGSTSFFRVL